MSPSRAGNWVLGLQRSAASKFLGNDPSSHGIPPGRCLKDPLLLGAPLPGTMLPMGESTSHVERDARGTFVSSFSVERGCERNGAGRISLAKGHVPKFSVAQQSLIEKGNLGLTVFFAIDHS